jgi:protein-L-isoaspartate(D-aspartate) O-methyltransferase
MKIDIEAARANMVQRQIRSWNVIDTRILTILSSCPREIFVPAEYKALAFAETEIPIDNHQIMLSPSMIGKILSALRLKGNEDILEIGTGSGYLTALLALAGHSVTSIEENKQLALQANKKIQALGLRNVEIIYGDAFVTLKGSKGFDTVVLNGSVSQLPKSILNQVKLGGCLFAVVGQEPVMQACIFTRIKEEEWLRSILFETMVPPLKDTFNASMFEF